MDATGDPNGAEVPRWPPFTKAGGQALYLGAPISLGGAADLEGLDVFDKVYAQVRGSAAP